MKKQSKYALDRDVVQNLVNSGYSRKNIADICHCSIHYVKHFLKKNKIRMVKYDTVNYRNNLIKHRQEIINLYEKCKRLRKVAEQFNCSPDALRNFFRSINYNYKTNNYIDLSEYLYDIKNYYYSQNKNLTEIGKLYNCSWVKIKDFLLSNKCKLKDKNIVLDNIRNSENFQRKCMSGSGRKKDYILPSGNIIQLRGYEPNFLNFVFSENLLTENDIIYNPSRIQYEYNKNLHFYYPDFYIPKYNLIVETKSSWIMKKQGIEKTFQKEKYTKEQGFSFLLIIDNDFKKIKDIFNKYNQYYD